MADDALAVYADYVCPFCYLGRRVLERVREDHPDPPAIEWRPFDLRANRRNDAGDITADAVKDEGYFEEAWRNVERLAEEYDVPAPQRADRSVDSVRAQQVSLFVREAYPDRWLAFDEAVYRAHWRESRDIEDPRVLAGLADEAGVPAQAVRDALEDPDVRTRLEEAFARARDRGITGVPTFVRGDDELRGAVPPARLRALVDGPRRSRASATGEE